MSQSTPAVSIYPRSLLSADDFDAAVLQQLEDVIDVVNVKNSDADRRSDVLAFIGTVVNVDPLVCPRNGVDGRRHASSNSISSRNGYSLRLIAPPIAPGNWVMTLVDQK